MVPTNSPAYAGNAFFVSLYINNIYQYKLLTESTSYFPYQNKKIIFNNYSEIQPPNLTVGLTSKQPKSPPKKAYPYKLLEVTGTSPISLTTTVTRGY
jgi:hypothetical protein